MSLAKQLAKNLRDAHFGGNWTTVDLKTVLSDVSWEAAQKSVHSIHSIASLTVHMTYYVGVIIAVLEEGKLTGKDELSWILPLIENKEDWERLQEEAWKFAEKAANLIEQLDDYQLLDDFVDPKYGTNYRNIAGIVEHLYYHLGQIVLIKKLLAQ